MNLFLDFLAIPFFLPFQLFLDTWRILFVAWLGAPISRNWPAMLRIPFRALPVALSCAVVGIEVDCGGWSAWSVLTDSDNTVRRIEAVESVLLVWMILSAVALARLPIRTPRDASPHPKSALNVLGSIDQAARAGVVAWAVAVGVHYVAWLWLTFGSSGILGRAQPLHAWFTLPRSLLVMLLVVVPAEIAARRYAFRGRLMIRAAAWGVLCTAIAGPSFFVFTGKNLAALAAAAGLSCWLLAKLDLPSFAGERLDSFILRARTRAGDPILLAALCALGIAAVAGAALTARSPAADLTTLLNSTSTPISDVELKLGKTIVRFGDIPIGGRRYVPLWRPSNLEDYEIRWREPSGAPQTVKFRGRLKGPPNMDLRFEILSDRVRILDGEYPMIGDNEILVTRE